MPEEKIGEVPKKIPCGHREHEPAKHMVRPPGIYKHTCPRCGTITVFTIPQGPIWNAGEHKSALRSRKVRISRVIEQMRKTASKT